MAELVGDLAHRDSGVVHLRRHAPAQQTDVSRSNPANVNATLMARETLERSRKVPAAEGRRSFIGKCYLVGTQDTIITPAAKWFMASRAHARTVQVRAGHLSLISQPEPISDLIIKAARATD